jgi:enoyl-CoA hydratase/carnithine racemase
VGFELSLACDFRIVSETCLYALPEQRLGQIPGSGGSARLQKIIGIARTKDIVMRSRRISARQAYDWGLATECVPDGDLEGATDALVPLRRNRARRSLLQPPAPVGRLPRGSGRVSRQACPQVQRDLRMPSKWQVSALEYCVSSCPVHLV